MTSTSIDLPSGAKLEVFVVPFAVGTKLYKVIANELKAVKIGENLDLGNLGSLDLNELKGVFFQLLGSDALEAVLFECFKFSTYNGLKITRDTFEPIEARGDFLPAAWGVLKINLTPFFKSLGSLLSAYDAPTSSGPR